MADGIVQVPVDSTGKKIDTSELTVGSNTVERQRMVIADPTDAAGLADVANTTLVGTEYGLVVRSVTEAVDGNFSALNPPLLLVGGLSTLGSYKVLGLTTKGVQGSTAVPTLDLKDSGRTSITFYIDRIAGITTEALATMNINKGGTVTTGTSYTVSTGKTLRLQSIMVTILSSTTTGVFGRVRVRSVNTGSLAASSPIIIPMDIGFIPGTAAQGTGGQPETITFADGIELSAGSSVGISHLINSTSSTVSVALIGYEY